jgi:hypothetical protein
MSHISSKSFFSSHTVFLLQSCLSLRAYISWTNPLSNRLTSISDKSIRFSILSNRRTPSPRITGTNDKTISSINSLLRNCWATFAPPSIVSQLFRFLQYFCDVSCVNTTSERFGVFSGISCDKTKVGTGCGFSHPCCTSIS